MFNKELELLRKENAELKEQVTALQYRLDTIELEFYRKIFSQININLKGEFKNDNETV